MEEQFNPDIEKEMEIPFKDVEETFKKNTKINLPDIGGQNAQAKKEDYFDEYKQNQDMNNNFSSPLMFNDESIKDNLVKWQLQVDWERIEHIIRGHKPKVDNEGNEYFVKIEEHYLNEYGVNTVLHFLSSYLSKEIFLSRYSMEQVAMIMKQFSKTFINFFYDNLVEFGLDNPRKKKMANMFCKVVIDLVDASYSRAIEGKQLELINKQFMVQQNQPLNEGYMQQQSIVPQKRGVINRIFG